VIEWLDRESKELTKARVDDECPKRSTGRRNLPLVTKRLVIILVLRYSSSQRLIDER